MAWIHYLRILAALAVVTIHVAAPLTSGTQTFDKNWWLATLFDSLARWCVPVFVLISGFLLLGKQEAMMGFYKKRSLKILIPAVFWIGLYSVYQVLTTPTTAREQFHLILTGRPYYHLWFVYMMIGLYLYTPFLRILVQSLSRRALGWLCTLLFTHTYLAMFVGSNQTFIYNISLMFLGYYLLGAWLTKFDNFPNALWLSIIFLIVTALTFTCCVFLRIKVLITMYTFHSPLILAMSVAIFLWVRKLFSGYKETQIILLASSTTLGIYLIHPMVLELVRLHWAYSATAIPIVSLAVFLISGGLVIVVKKIPGLSRTV